MKRKPKFVVVLSISLFFLAFSCVNTGGEIDWEDDPQLHSLSGTILVRIVDQEQGSLKQYQLLTDLDERIILEFPRDPHLKTGDIVEINGMKLLDNIMEVASFKPLNLQPRRLDGPIVRTPKQRKVAILAMSEASANEASALAVVNGSVDSVNHFYGETSRNIDTFSAKIFKKYTISYSSSDCEFNNTDNLSTRLINAFKNDGHKPEDYDHIVTIVPKSCGSDWSGAWAYVGSIRDDGTLRFSQVSMYKDNVITMGFLVHELGHNLGMNHARSMNCGSSPYTPKGSGCKFDEYGNYNDPMGNGEGVYFGAPYQRFMGWVGASHIATAGKSATFNLQPSDGPMCGLRAVRIPIPGEAGNYFYVEYRRARSDSRYAGTGKLGPSGRQNTVLITRSGEGSGGNSSTYTDRVELGTTRYEGAKLNVRYDLGGGVAVKVLSTGGAYAQVAVEMPGSAVHRNDGGAQIPAESDGSFGVKSCSTNMDSCPSDPNKTDPGICGCGTPDKDSDGDGTADCQDKCPSDSKKTQPGQCGCGISDKDSDGDGTADCLDKCPADPKKTQPGQCGCGVTEGTCGTPSGSAGLKGEYFSTIDLTGPALERVDATINFDWKSGSPDPKIPTDRFSARWTGFIVPQYSQTYTFYSVSDDGFRLYVNGILVINDWSNHAPRERSGTIALQAGKSTSIKVEYFENTGGAVAKLFWSSPSQAKQIIPSGRLKAAALGTGGETPPVCDDNGAFIDAQGYRCSEWLGYDCAKAVLYYGYTEAQEVQIKDNCKKSCNLCQ
jgi:hypothetical protein